MPVYQSSFGAILLSVRVHSASFAICNQACGKLSLSLVLHVTPGPNCSIDFRSGLKKEVLASAAQNCVVSALEQLSEVVMGMCYSKV